MLIFVISYITSELLNELLNLYPPVKPDSQAQGMYSSAVAHASYIQRWRSQTHNLLNSYDQSIKTNTSNKMARSRYLHHALRITLYHQYLFSISGCKIKYLDKNAFERMTRLKELNLSHNELRIMPGDLTMPQLRRLDISDNCLSSMDFLEKLSSLEELSIEGNGLQVICEELPARKTSSNKSYLHRLEVFKSTSCIAF